MRIFKSNIIAILLYRGETWRMTKAHDERLDTFLHTCLKWILKVHWPIGVSNDEIRRRAGIEKIRNKYDAGDGSGHVPRMAPNRNPHVAQLIWAPSGKRKRGMPRKTWTRTVEWERPELGLSG